MIKSDKRVKSKEDLLKVFEEEGYTLSSGGGYYRSFENGINFNMEMFDCCGKTMDEKCTGARSVVGAWSWEYSWLEDAKSEIEKAYDIWVKEQEQK